MAMTLTNKNTANRRRASRIYEQADLFYQKISNETDDAKPSNSSDGVNLLAEEGAQQAPESQSQENETLNVNISATGISFTCKEELQAGEHLVVRILLLSSMTVITVSCEVVYCKPSNPFENDRYPFLIGGRFINIREVDTELLEQHIRRKKFQRYPLQALLAMVMIATIEAPDVILELMVGITEFIAEFAVESAFILYEIVSMYLDHAVEAIFHTKIHDTQLISFYLMWVVGIAAGLLMSKKIVVFCKNLFFKWQIYFYRKKASAKYYWHEKSLMHKTGVIGGSIAVFLTYVMFFI